MFQSRVIKLKNGKTIERPRNWVPLIILIVLTVIWGATEVTNFNFMVIFTKAPIKIGSFFQRLFPMNTQYFERIWTPIGQTLAMSYLGTVIGAFFSFFAMYFTSNNLNSNKLAVFILRMILSIIRTIPITVYAIVLSVMFGLGTFVGTLATALFTFSIMTKMMYEYVETVDMSAHEALIATGCSKFKAFWVAVMPQVWGVYASQSLYNLEMNVRNSAVLGYVGAGGIGLLLNHQIGLNIYKNVTPILISLLVTVLVIEFVSRSIRKRLS